jgi:hypothetical protein
MLVQLLLAPLRIRAEREIETYRRLVGMRELD